MLIEIVLEVDQVLECSVLDDFDFVFAEIKSYQHLLFSSLWKLENS
jgi:hypothetical protein